MFVYTQYTERKKSLSKWKTMTMKATMKDKKTHKELRIK